MANSTSAQGFPGGSDSKESACNTRDPGLIPRSERSPGEGMAIHSSILAWRIPWKEEPSGLQSMGLQRIRHNEATNTFILSTRYKGGFPRGASGKEFCLQNAGDMGSIPGLVRSPGGGNVNPLQYSCLGNSMDKGAWWATVHRVSKT